MTRIEKLELHGFKSFAKKTILKFPANFTVIAGPNGSGKSNILDSIVFVLGRTSAKSLRADKMFEMIFNGGKNKKPSEFAKVTITFDNTDKKFPYEDPEIQISRKVNRKGVSTYKINGQTVTREKVIEVLRKANINPDGHNIILQGDITDVVEMSPRERREIIDDISGISEFEEKRNKAQRELTTVEERLKESLIRLTEKEERLAKLKAEKEAAEKYQFLTKELDKLRASLAKKKLAQAEKSFSTLQEKITEREKQIEQLKKEIEEKDKELENKEKELKKVESKLFDRSSNIELVKNIEKIKTEVNSKRSKIQSNEFEIRRLEDYIQKIEQLHQRELESLMPNSVKEVLKLNRTGIYGTISSLMKVDDKYKTAIEVAAGNHMNDIVVSDKEVAIEAVRYLKKNKIGRATFLPLDKIKEKNPESIRKYLKIEGVIGIALNLIKFDQKYWHAFSHIFGDTLIIDKIETAKKVGIGNARMVTLDGDLIEKSGAIIGGFYHHKKTRFDTSEIEKLKKQIVSLEEDSKIKQSEIEILEKKLSDLLKKEKEGTSEISEAEKKRIEIERLLDEIKEERRKLFEKKLTLSEEVNRMKINRARFEAELENIKAEFENYKKIETYDEDPEILKKKIRDTLVKINSLGPINQKALEEYKELKEVYDSLKEKIDMLTKEREKILGIIEEIESRRKETFMNTFNEIDKQFKRIFKELVGGDGKLKLEGENLDEAGLVISANPPGRKMLNIESMSGGEKTLTALAFLFAIQQIKPAPFYILDEIDAALDKKNTKKITEFLKHNSKFAQFIVISHNDYTIEAADCVYGVSMEDGESRIVGIKMPS